MRDFFSNFFVAILLTGVLSRFIFFLVKKKMPTNISCFVSFFISGIVLLIFIPIFVGFGVFVVEYLLSLIIWFVIDLIRLRIISG
jgi:hypothetical protein